MAAHCEVSAMATCIRLDADAGTLEVLVDARQSLRRARRRQADLAANETGVGRELFAAFRRIAGAADARRFHF
jgi:phosphogluconate dehydratase